MVRLAALGLLVLAVLAGMACSDDGKKVEAKLFPVQVDGEAASFNASFLAYFPSEVQAHAGDTVEFTSVFSGEPHTVTLGADVDAVFGLIAEACPNGGLADPNCQEGPPPAYEDRYNEANGKLPELLPEGPGDANQAAAQPCFLATGSAPAEDACSAEQQQQPDFDGTQTYYNSGWLEDQAVFSVKLADDIAPGTYDFFCLLHREGMSGTITVVDKDTEVPSPEEVQQQGDDALNEVVTKLQPEFDKLASLTSDTAQAGAGSEEVSEAEIDEFGPKEATIPVGGSVTWSVLGPHTISFNAPEDARPILVKAADGSVHVNEKAAAPQNSPGQPQDPDAPPSLIDAGEWDGQGFHSSGLILSFPGEGGALWSYKLTFSTAGTYTYLCLVHPDMEGTVKVGE